MYDFVAYYVAACGLAPEINLQGGRSTMSDIEEIDLRRIQEEDARAIASLVVSVWPKPGRTIDTLTTELTTKWKDWAGPEAQHPRSFLVREAGRVIAHASLYPRTVGTAAGDLAISALARVCTDPAKRGRKLGQKVALAAFEYIDNGTFPFALFQTRESVQSFYEQLGAVAVDNNFVNSQADDPTANPFWDKVIMVYPAKEGWPKDEIDIRGPGW